MTTAEQYAVDLVAVLAQRPDAVAIARYALRKLERRARRKPCVVCGSEVECRRIDQRYCGSKCRERHKTLARRELNR